MTDTLPTIEADGFEFVVLDGLARYLTSEGVMRDPVAYNPDPTVPYEQGEIPLVLNLYPDGPGSSITLAEYVVSDDPTLSDSVLGVQVTIKAADRQLYSRLVSDVFDAVQNAGRGSLGTVTLVTAARASGTNSGQDSNNRLVRYENYYLTVHRPSTHRA